VKDIDLIRVLLADDHSVTRRGIRAFVEKDPRIEIIDEARDGQEAITLSASLSPAVILMDIEMPLMDGIEATKAIRLNQPAIKVIMLSSHSSDKIILASLSAGANGYCLKDIDDDRLIMAIHTVAKGDYWIDSSIADSVLRLLPLENSQATSGNHNHNRFNLSEREIQVLTLIVEGKTNQIIASHLHLSVDTIKNHLKTIMDKLSVSDRTQAAVKAVREELI
jgi:two-component system, NarL family, response regulator LiaR